MNVDARYKVETNDYAVLSDKNVKKIQQRTSSTRGSTLRPRQIVPSELRRIFSGINNVVLIFNADILLLKKHLKSYCVSCNNS